MKEMFHKKRERRHPPPSPSPKTIMIGLDFDPSKVRKGEGWGNWLFPMSLNRALSTQYQPISTKYWNCFTIPGRFGQEEHWLDTISNRKLLFNQRWELVLMIHLQKTSCLQVLAKNLCPHQRAKGLPIRWEKPIVILRRERIRDF